VDGVTVLQDNTCTACHNYNNDEFDVPRTAGNSNLVELPENESPAQPRVQQVFLANKDDYPETLPSSSTLRFEAYDHLLTTHPRAIVDGVLMQQSVIDLVPRVDENGDPVLELGVQIVDEVPRLLTVGRSLNPGNAATSTRFFEKMEQPQGPDETDHQGFLTGVELKLIREWIDIGGQYYNNPFDAPEN